MQSGWNQLLGLRTLRVNAVVVAISVMIALLLSLGGCSSAGPVPVVERAQPPSEKINHHWVSSGETLYAIAWRYNMDPAMLARANGISAPYRIQSGQKLSLDLSHTPRRSSTRHSIASSSTSSSNKTDAKKVFRPIVSSTWRWPTQGEVTKRYRNSGSTIHKGVDIRGKRGQPVYAANHGVVVYAGAGLPAYGNLLIVKHNETFLSAYAHNSKLMVSEGDNVKVGQKIAEIGKSGTTYEHLHFEIRKRGVPIDPLTVLPRV